MGMGETPGCEGNDAPNFTKDLFVAESSPYYAAFIQDTYHPNHALTITAVFAGISSAARPSATTAWSTSIPTARTQSTACPTPAPKSTSAAATLALHHQSE